MENQNNKANVNEILSKLLSVFPEKNMHPSNVDTIEFDKWKLPELKKFLMVTGDYKGLSKAKKDKLLLIVVKKWNEIFSEYYCDNVNDSARDDELASLPSPLSFPPSSPTTVGSPMSSLFSSPPTSPIPTLQRYPNTQDNMTENDFSMWTVQQLHNFLSDRCINKSGTKAKLVKNAFGAYRLNLPITQTDHQEEKNIVENDKKKKLILENGLLTLPSPRILVSDWIEAPSCLPETLYGDVNKYLTKKDAGKAFKGGKSLFASGHLKQIMVHMISPNIRYCFVRALCHPEQKLSKPPYDVWVCLHKDTGAIEVAECSCVAGVSGHCKHVGALLWYIEENVRQGNNKVCTSKKQQWSVPSKKQQTLHSPDVLSNIGMNKPSAKQVLSSPPSKQKRKRSEFDPRIPSDRFEKKLYEADIDTLADITNGNSGIVCLLRKSVSPDEWIKNVDSVARFETVETSEHIDLPTPIDKLVVEDINCFSKFVNQLSISDEQKQLVQELTSQQSDSQLWFDYRLNRITASKFKDAVQKVNDNFALKNPDKSKTFVSKVCGYYPKFKSKATEWGITNEPIARKIYLKTYKSKHVNFDVKEVGLFISVQHPFIGASPDGIVSCSCHNHGILEIKCPWSARDLTIAEFASTKTSFLECNSDQKVHLTKDHAHYYQVQCQMLCTGYKWCDFFVCTSKENFVERIMFDEHFVSNAVSKAQVAYEKIIFPELKNRQWKKSIDDEKCVKDLVESLVDDVCFLIDSEYIDFDISSTNNVVIVT